MRPLLSFLRRFPSGFPVLRRSGALLLAWLALWVGVLGCARPSWPNAPADRTERFLGPGARLLQWTQPDGPEAFCAVEAQLSQPYLRWGVTVGHSTLPGGNTGTGLGLEPLSRQAERLTQPDRYPIAGVNGDFFLYPDSKQNGIPTNGVVLNGEVIHSLYPRSCLVIDAAGRPSIRVFRDQSRVTLPDGTQHPLDGVNQPRAAGKLVLFTPRCGVSTRTDPKGVEAFLEPAQPVLRYGGPQRALVRAVQKETGNAALQPTGWVLSGSGAAGELLANLKPGDTVEVQVAFDPPLAAGDQLLGGGPRLVRDGKVSVDAEGGSINGSFATARHPRTAIGYNGQELFLVVVDGRQPGYSAGMSLPDLAKVLVDLGCTDAMNMDGGGSSTLWARGAVINRPSDGRERAVADGLLLFSTAPHGAPVRLVAESAEIDALPGAEVPLTAAGEDQYFNPVPVPARSVEWSVDPALGSIIGGQFVARADVTPPAGADSLSGAIRFVSGSAQGMLPVRLYPHPTRVELLPAATRLLPRSQLSFRARAYDARGHLLSLPDKLTWSAPAGVGAIDESGTLLTGANAARGGISVTVAGVTSTAAVEVTEAAAHPLEDFEGAGKWTARVNPAGVTGVVKIASGLAHGGSRALRIEYDFSGGAGTRAVYALTTLGLGKPFALRSWVYGDGQGAWLRARVRDSAGTAHVLDLARNVDWKDTWKELRAPVSDDWPGPLTLEAIYVVETDAARKEKGVILVDDLSVDEGLQE